MNPTQPRPPVAEPRPATPLQANPLGLQEFIRGLPERDRQGMPNATNAVQQMNSEDFLRDFFRNVFQPWEHVRNRQLFRRTFTKFSPKKDG